MQEIQRNGLDPWSGRSPGVGTGNPLQYSYLENSMNKRTWWVVVHEVAKSRTQLKTHTHAPSFVSPINLFKVLSLLSHLIMPTYSRLHKKKVPTRRGED